MTDPTTLPRPRQVTLAAWMIMVGSVLVVLTVFDRVAGLNDLETRQAVERFLAEPPGDGLGLDVTAALEAIRLFAMVAGGCAAAAAILGYHVLRRSRGARIALTVLAIPLFLSGMVAGGFLSSVVAASALMLWLEPSRDWFAGRPAREARPEQDAARHAGWPPPPSAPAAPPEQPPAQEWPVPEAPSPEGPAQEGPRPHPGFGAVPPPYPGAEGGWAPPAAPARRPDAVLWACVLTWVFSALAVVVMGVSAIVLAASPDLVLDEVYKQNPELARQGVGDHTVQVATYATAGFTVLWCVAASVLAVLVLRRSPWARTGLLASAAAAGLVCLLASVGSILMLAPALACAATFSLLLRADVRAWASAP